MSVCNYVIVFWKVRLIWNFKVCKASKVGYGIQTVDFLRRKYCLDCLGINSNSIIRLQFLSRPLLGLLRNGECFLISQVLFLGGSFQTRCEGDHRLSPVWYSQFIKFILDLCLRNFIPLGEISFGTHASHGLRNSLLKGNYPWPVPS